MFTGSFPFLFIAYESGFQGAQSKRPKLHFLEQFNIFCCSSLGIVPTMIFSYDQAMRPCKHTELINRLLPLDTQHREFSNGSSKEIFFDSCYSTAFPLSE